jgi:hypothetical protein
MVMILLGVRSLVTDHLDARVERPPLEQTFEAKLGSSSAAERFAVRAYMADEGDGGPCAGITPAGASGEAPPG